MNRLLVSAAAAIVSLVAAGAEAFGQPPRWGSGMPAPPPRMTPPPRTSPPPARYQPPGASSRRQTLPSSWGTGQPRVTASKKTQKATGKSSTAARSGSGKKTQTGKTAWKNAPAAKKDAAKKKD